MNLARQHFIQTIEALRIGKKIKLNPPAKEIKLNKKNPKFKTIFLDLDETLIHCDENAHNGSAVKLNFPIEGGGTIAVNINQYIGGSQDQAALPVIYQRTCIFCLSYYLHCECIFLCRCGAWLFGPSTQVFFLSALPAALYPVERILHEGSENCQSASWRCSLGWQFWIYFHVAAGVRDPHSAILSLCEG